jgi:hypothetical protein
MGVDSSTAWWGMARSLSDTGDCNVLNNRGSGIKGGEKSEIDDGERLDGGGSTRSRIGGRDMWRINEIEIEDG